MDGEKASGMLNANLRLGGECAEAANLWQAGAG
jgi:hypothetical protein